MKQAFNDFIYLAGLWFILRLNRSGAGELIEKWGKNLKTNIRE